MKRRSWAVLLAVLMVALGCAPAPAEPASGARSAEPLRVLGSWEPRELEVVRDVIAPFEARTGLVVELESTRDPRSDLAKAMESASQPDIAALPGPSLVADLARAGQVVDLGEVIDVGVYKTETAPAFVNLGTVDGRLVAVVFKGTVKGLLWFDPCVVPFEPARSGDDLRQVARSAVREVAPWCVGLASDASSGWPGTDWIEDFVLRQSGPQVYDDWVSRRVAWSSPEIRWAFSSYGIVVAESAGGPAEAVDTHFSRAGDGLLSNPPECLMVHQGTFMAAFLDESIAQLGGRYDAIPFPDIDPEHAGSLIGAADLMVLLRDRPEARDLMRYLVSEEAQTILVSHGGALSGNMFLDGYPDEVLRSQAQLLADAHTFRFDGSDVMPAAMSQAFNEAVLEYTTDPDRLDDILARLDRIQAEAYQAP
jgi:alpha-glucoside transport system substrate-binding protein